MNRVALDGSWAAYKDAPSQETLDEYLVEARQALAEGEVLTDEQSRVYRLATAGGQSLPAVIITGVPDWMTYAGIGLLGWLVFRGMR